MTGEGCKTLLREKKLISRNNSEVTKDGSYECGSVFVHVRPIYFVSESTLEMLYP